jgi:hypothetical protein
MFLTYEDYLPMPGSLTFEKMAALHREIREEAESDTDAIGLYEDLLKAAAKYSESRALWSLWSQEKKLAEDAARTSRHNHVIDCFNILARYLKQKGKSASWRDVLGDEKENPDTRKRIGDFACYLVLVESLNAR